MNKYISVLLIQLLITLVAHSQNHKSYSQYHGEPLLSSSGSVTLLPDFHVPSGSNLRIYIQMSAPSVNAIPSNNHNYILSRIFKVSGVNTTNLNETRSYAEETSNILYFDGLGRPLQDIAIAGSPNYKDIVTPRAYDALGRESVKYQPYMESTDQGSYRASAISNQLAYYMGQTMGSSIKATTSPFSITLFEPSPLNRIEKQGFPGTTWQPTSGTTDDHTVKMVYGANEANEVKLWTINSNNNGANANAYYQTDKLYKTSTKDENWQLADGKAGTTDEYKDFEGRIILKRVWQTDNKSLNTYYIYDDFGSLRYVLPPAVNENGHATLDSFTETDQSFLNYIYGYHYDDKKRLIEKKLPGKGWEYMVYNKLNQLVMIQDSNQRAKANQEWLFTKYDVHSRVIMTGIYVGNENRTTLQQNVNNQNHLWETRDDSNHNSTGTGYTNVSLPHTNIAVYHILNYYDDYDFYNNSFGAPAGSQSKGISTKGLLTGIKVNILATNTLLQTNYYYDEKSRVIQTKSQHHLGGIDVIDNTFSFVGELLSSIRSHTRDTTTTTIATTYEYDHIGRKTKTKQQINNQPEVTIAEYVYNEIGQLKEKKLHNGLQTTTYSYNERSWLKTSNSNEFGMELKYNDGTIPQYNGNIANQTYTNGNGQKTFNYTYDKLNRLTNGEISSTELSETLTYDVMGNIKTLQRNTKDIMTYQYTGNRLSWIQVGSGEVAEGDPFSANYQYDANGNCIFDAHNNATISYNYLNLPLQIHKQNEEDGVITYSYDAMGRKLSKHYLATQTTTDYIEGIQYTNGAIDFIQTEEGIARKNGNNYRYEYNITDHLGNVRATIYRNPTTNQLEVLQRDDYYAFGLRKGVHEGNNKYLYNGKELQTELEQYDYGARFYDPVIGKWNVVDPLVEKMRRHSPYNYAFNNPIRFIDPDGRMAIDHIDVEKNKDGTYTVVGGEANADKNIYVVDNKGNRTGEVVGQMLTEYSFHDNDGNAVVGAVIDPSDNSGQNFMDNEIIGDNPGLVHYMKNATGGEKYDFKTNGIDERPEGMSRTQYSYRGMKYNGKFASGRDIGNVGAGYVAGRKGLSWGAARTGFDALESYQQGGFATEGQPTQRAQRVGFDAGSAVFEKIKFERQWQKATNPLPPGPKW